jgi:hypothetical protein
MVTYRHDRACARKFKGIPENYNAINSFIDSSKLAHGDVKHRALYHHTLGIELCERLFGLYITNSDNIQVPVREIAEFHIVTDLGFIPTPADYLKNMTYLPWMQGERLLKGKRTYYVTRQND